MSPASLEHLYARAKEIGLTKAKLHGRIGRAFIESNIEDAEFNKVDQNVTLIAKVVGLNPEYLRTGAGQRLA